jgi:O-antigen/teichoic acid export membrane protein
MPVSVAKHPTTLFGSRAIVNAGALIFASSLALSVSGFVFHAIASRRLGVDAYGTLYALISLYSLAILPVSVFAPVVTRYSAEFGALHDDEHVRGLIGRIVRAFLVVGAMYIVAGFVLAVPLASFLHIAAWEIPIVGVLSAVATLSVTMRAIGQGIHAYGAYAFSMVGEGIAKVCALALLAVIGLTVFGATGALLCGSIAAAALISVPIFKRYRSVEPRPVLLDWRRIIATTVGAAVLTLTITAMGFADVLIVKHVFPSDDAGLYAAASLCGKILLYFVGFIPAILIPQATHRHARGERTRKILWAAVLFVAVVSAFGVLGFHFAGLSVLHVLTGHSFDASLPLLTPYAAAMAALAMTSALGAYGMATHRLAFVVPLLIAMLATLATIALVHPSLMQVVNELLFGNVVMTAAVAVSLGIQGVRGARA